ncbi:unnamed protein product [Timema podura]|uniref:Uncharacterized protein n=1 Tax=Timema podura TaxID=61482 RepID=A0ABN7PG55_TIMPD|nr:unnamed protein product [Timema podura]
MGTASLCTPVHPAFTSATLDTTVQLTGVGVSKLVTVFLP